MREDMKKENAIKIIKDIVSSNPGCTKLFIYDKYKELGGTYYIDGRNEAHYYNFDKLMNSMIGLKILVQDEDFMYHLNEEYKH